MSIDCGIIENSLSHPEVIFTLFSDEVVVSTDEARWVGQSGIPVTEFNELGVMGAAVYSSAPGKHARQIFFSFHVHTKLLPFY